MKQKNLIIGIFSLGAVILAAGLISSASAQTDINEFRTEQRQNRSFMNQGANLNEEQKLEMEERRAERQAEAQLYREKMETAINSGSYETWVTMVKENIGDDAFVLERVNADNFAEFVANHNAREINGGRMNQGKGFGRNNHERMGRGLGLHQGDCLMTASLE
jgi:activator of 2-hydroxyglutaryl-CoA dehydratase